MQKVTVRITTYNEENRIRRVLESLKKFDTVIVYDKSSTDRTREIAEEFGAVVMKIRHTDFVTDEEIEAMDKVLDECGNEWILDCVCSDVCHYGLYEEIAEAINGYGYAYEVIGIPFFLYSMGINGKNSYYGQRQYKNLLYRREVKESAHAIHILDVRHDARRCILRCRNEQIGIYHLTHENIDLIMDRHTRYAKVVAENRHNSGRKKERELRSCTVEALKLIKDYIIKGMFKLKWDGLAQFFMLMMYFSQCYLYTYFDNKKQKEIKELYASICDTLQGEDDRM